MRVTDGLTLDAGSLYPPAGVDEPWVVQPPARAMYEQVLDYLELQPDPPRRPGGDVLGREGVAAAAVCLRWGTFLAILADRSKPLWSEAAVPDRRQEVSRINDAEMARINIEASAAMAGWVDRFRDDEGVGHFARLVDRALAYLPMPQRSVRPAKRSFFASLSAPDLRAALPTDMGPAAFAGARATVAAAPTRVFANALVNAAWRNGSAVEDVHAGVYDVLPLNRRRITPAEERDLMRRSASGFAWGMTVLWHFVHDEPDVPWPDQVLPYHHAHLLLATPSDWTLTERSREVYYRHAPFADEAEC